MTFPQTTSVSRLSSVGLLACAIGCAASADAAILTISFTGEIEELTTFGDPGAPGIDPFFDVGDAVSGTIIFDDSVASSSSTPTTARYSAISAFNITIGGQSYDLSPGATGFITVGDDDMAGAAAPFRDSVLFQAFDISGPVLSGIAADRLQFALGELDLSTLTSTALPSVAELLALAADDLFAGNLNFVSFDNDEVARFGLTGVSVDSREVPAPAALALLLFGIGGLRLASVRRKTGHR